MRDSWHARWHREAHSQRERETHRGRETRRGVGRDEPAGQGSVDEFGVETMWVSGGHVTSFFLQHAAFRNKIVAALERMG